MILFINACVRKDSRTKKIADLLLSKLGDFVCEVRLSEVDFPKTDEDFLKWRDACIGAGDFSAPYFELGKQFAAADVIVMAAPYWDMSFPAVLKQYIEHINIRGVTFAYGADGIPYGLCRARKLYYVMTAGGDYVPEGFGFGYIKALAEGFYGISQVELIKAVGLDIYGADVEEIMKSCIEKL